MSEQNFHVDTPWGWRERLRFKLFPSRYCELPEAPATYEDVLICKTVAVLSFVDRLRVLISGRIVVETKTVTENRIGAHVTASTAYPTLKRWER